MKNTNKIDLCKISNNYIIKSLFSYLYSKDILKLVQNNKKLQNKLNINIENYKKISEFPKYEYEKKIEEDLSFEDDTALSELFGKIISSCTSCIFIVYLLVYSILLITLDTFDNNNTKKNYNKSLENNINNINLSLFVLVGCVIISWILLFFYLYDECSLDYGCIKLVKSIIIVIINLIHFIFEGLVIWKLVISYQILEGNIPWFMIMDYVFLVLNLLHIIILIFCTVIFFKELGIAIKTTCILKSFNNIKINYYEIPFDFNKWKEKERKKYVLNICYVYNKIYFDSKYYMKIINNYRRENQIPDLEFVEDNTIPNYLINQPGEIMLYPEKNIFKLSNKEYIFKYPWKEFGAKIMMKDTEIYNILLKDNLNCIKKYIISKEEEYFIIYEKYDSKKNENEDSFLLEDNENKELEIKLLDNIIK